MSRAAITGGHVLQGSTYAQLMKIDADRRLLLAHYLSRPGAIERLGKMDPADLASGFLTAKQAPVSLDPPAISSRMMDMLRRSAELDHTLPFDMARAPYHWALAVDAAQRATSRARFAIDSPTVQTLRLTIVENDLSIVELCETLALHNRLLTALLQMIEHSRIGASPRPQVVDKLRPAIDYLLHLWMPTARLNESKLPLWEILVKQPGFARQWEAPVSWIRDQVALSTVVQLCSVTDGKTKRT